MNWQVREFMKRLFVISLLSILLTGCIGLNKQVNQIKALEDCKYAVKSADSITLAGIDVKDLIGKDIRDIIKMPRLALALLRKDVPLRARVNLAINNPTDKLAAINQFEYRILVQNNEIANGLVNQRIVVEPNGGNVVVPIRLNTNVYDLVMDDRTVNAVTDFVLAKEDNKHKETVVTIKIKPTLDLGNRQIKYPGYIDIDKEVSSKDLF